MSAALTTVSFATVASHNYIDQAAGLLINLRQYYPDSEIVICALDDATEQAFSRTDDQNLTCVPATTVWGEKYWRNLTCWMSIAERALLPILGPLCAFRLFVILEKHKEI